MIIMMVIIVVILKMISASTRLVSNIRATNIVKHLLFLFVGYELAGLHV